MSDAGRQPEKEGGRKGTKPRKKPVRKAPTKATGDTYPTAFELAMLAAAHSGDLGTAERCFNEAAEHLRRWKVRTPEEQLDMLTLDEYEDLMPRIFGKMAGATRKLYCDKRTDEVKAAIRKATGRKCGYKTARDYLRNRWKEIRENDKIPETIKDADHWKRWQTSYRQENGAWETKAWMEWCDEHRRIDAEEAQYLEIPLELLLSTLERLKPEEPDPWLAEAISERAERKRAEAKTRNRKPRKPS